jgi:hypothetical protein
MTDDAEIDAMRTVLTSLDQLDPEARGRVLSWAARRFDLEGFDRIGRPSTAGMSNQARSSDYADPRHETLAEAFAAANPKTGGLKALIVGYWKQIRDGAVSLDGQSINTELKHMGHHVANITDAMNELQRQKPQLAVQLKKSGTSKQARKTYKITTEGVKVAEAMIRGDS